LRKEKILVGIGPSSKLTATGQSLHFERTCRELLRCDKILYYSKYSNLLIDSIFFLLNIVYLGLFKGAINVYYTPSRTNKGLIRDALIILFCNFRGKSSIIAHIHGSDFNDFYSNSKVKFLIRWVYSRHSSTIVLSPGIGKEIQKIIDLPLAVIPNNIGLENINNEINFSYQTDSDIRIIWCSNIMHSKGIEVFLCALGLLSSEHKKLISVDIIGKVIGDDYKSTLEMTKDFDNQLKKLKNIGLKINYLGSLPNSMVVDYFKKSNIFVLPTFYKTEAMPLSVLEALVYHCRVILTDWKFLKEIFSDYKVHFIEPHNVQKLSEALRDEIVKIKSENKLIIDEIVANSLSVQNNSNKSDLQMVEYIKSILI
jgi:glycosyltransferase involved in cell wall biosynthesis